MRNILNIKKKVNYILYLCIDYGYKFDAIKIINPIIFCGLFRLPIWIGIICGIFGNHIVSN